MADDDDDLPTPPPGGYLSDPRPDSASDIQREALERAEEAALERIAAALEALQDEIGEIRRLLAVRLGPGGGGS